MSATTKNCEECANHRAVLGNELACALGHKPRWFSPKGTLDQNYGWKRKCDDFRARRDYKMSLDFYLKDIKGEYLFDSNITHDLGKMAYAAGIYKVLWRPDEIGVETAGQAIPILREGLCKMVSDPAYYKQFDSGNGWGLYVHFVPFCIGVLEACIANPDATIEVSR